MDELRHLWLEATPAVALERPCFELSTETSKQIQLDLTRTFGPMLFQHSFDEAAVNSRREKVEALLVKWLQSHKDVAYTQGMHHLMAMCYRQVETDDGAVQVFDFIICQVNENLFHADGLKLWEAVQGTSQQLQSLIREVCPVTAKKLTDADVNFFPMIVQNWMIDLYINVLPADAAARLWHRIILDNTPGVPLKFAQHLLLSKREDILTCRPEDLNEVLTNIPNGIRSAEDVDVLLETDPTEFAQAVPVNAVHEEIQNWKFPTWKLPARLPKRWKPWKFVAVAMVVPWLFLHSTAVHQPHVRGAPRPHAFRRPCLKGHGDLKFVPEMTWPAWPAWPAGPM
eukprot:s2694_g6.t1